MRAYFSYMKMRFVTTLQYRAAAIAGIMTQFFFGAMFIMMYDAYYRNNIETPLPWEQLISYLWLIQAFFNLTYFSIMDNDIRKSIITGQVAYELVRPFNLYWQWFSRIAASRVANGFMRFSPVIIVASLLPEKYSLKLPVSPEAFILFLITLILGVVLILCFSMILYGVMLYMTSLDGIFRVYSVFSEFFGGGIVPIPFLPKALQVAAYILPFRLSMDLPYRLYVGNISIGEGIEGVITQLVWIVITMLVGNLMFRNVSKKLVVQGG